MVLTGGGSRLLGAARSAATSAANALRAWRIARAGDEIMATAQAGGRHAGWLETYAGKTAGELGRAVRSLESRAKLHEGWLRDPASHVKNWNELRPQHQQSLIKHWKGEIQTAREQIEILSRIR